MNEFKGTPGPWSVGDRYGEDALIGGSGGAVAYAAWDGGSGCHLAFNNDDDARLIAAAPDLYHCADLLESLCAWMLHRFGPDTPEGNEASFRLTAARAAIAKALQP